ncbi:MAG: putative DNA binding domain-containing protein [Verrucomicrobia bacterium]|nr:putative DNA binding domain-containing protein [Verrucomicrobiota bacterium]
MLEGQHQDRKSLRLIHGTNTDWRELAWMSVGMANAHGGSLLLGIEDDSSVPPKDQTVTDAMVDAVRKRIPQLTVNVAIDVQKVTHDRGGQYIVVRVLPSRSTVAATTDGRYALRVGDETRTLMPEDLIRLTAEKSAFSWETTVSRKVPRQNVSGDQLKAFVASVRASDRISAFVKDKEVPELLDHYLFTDGPWLTNLGVLWVGRREDRARLLYAPIIQFIRYDADGRKIRKQVWDDFSMNPRELIESVWHDLPEWKEGDEIRDGLYRKNVPHYQKAVIRELLANALVHRPYTTRGDIFINLHPERLEIHNPGLLPLGVTPDNILHASAKRNIHLAKVFYDLQLMEQEGSGYDRIYESLLLSAKRPPSVEEGADRVAVTVRSRILKTETLRFMEQVNDRYELRQRELIALGLLAQHEALTALEFTRLLELEDRPERLRDWLGRLLTWGLVTASGRTRAKTYRVAYSVLQNAGFEGATTLKVIEPYRLQELIMEDLRRHPSSGYAEIHDRIGREIPESRVKRMLYSLVRKGILTYSGARRWRQYSIARDSAK